MKLTNDQLTQIQQAFVRRYMVDERIVGVRIRRVDGTPALVVELDEAAGGIDLPDRFHDLSVITESGAKAVLAYAV